jgi:hypothetical protein
VLQYSANGGALFPTSSVFESMPNTPPVFATWMLGLVLDDIISQGGLEAIELRMARRAGKLYKLIDRSGGFYFNSNADSCRSRMNAVFRIKGGNRSLEQKFVSEAEKVSVFPQSKGDRASSPCLPPDATIQQELTNMAPASPLGPRQEKSSVLPIPTPQQLLIPLDVPSPQAIFRA